MRLQSSVAQMPAPALPRKPVRANVECTSDTVRSSVTPTARSGAIDDTSPTRPTEVSFSLVIVAFIRS
ncbi:MAG: hypothetical protein M3680_20200 [Myxococcota bacterium]|nr:hypothetical protein [Myxococcota bacterium]